MNFTQPIKVILFSVVIMTSHMLFATYGVRVYCRYIPQEVNENKNLSIDEKMSQIRQEKLLKNVENNESCKVETSFKENTYEVELEKYLALSDFCQQQIGDKGTVIALKASSATGILGYETIAGQYRLSAKDSGITFEKKERLNENEDIQFGDDIPEDLLSSWIMVNEEVADNIDEENIGALGEQLASHPSKLKRIAAKLTKTTVEGVRTLSENPNAQLALKVAAILALNFYGPAFAAGAADLLYPYVYRALFGNIPSMALPSFWLIYYPTKAKTYTWVYNNFNLVINTLSSIYTTLSSISQEDEAVDPAKVKDELEQMEDEIEEANEEKNVANILDEEENTLENICMGT